MYVIFIYVFIFTSDHILLSFNDCVEMIS